MDVTFGKQNPVNSVQIASLIFFGFLLCRSWLSFVYMSGIPNVHCFSRTHELSFIPLSFTHLLPFLLLVQCSVDEEGGYAERHIPYSQLPKIMPRLESAPSSNYVNG